jgi:hypothetical protein
MSPPTAQRYRDDMPDAIVITGGVKGFGTTRASTGLP